MRGLGPRRGDGAGRRASIQARLDPDDDDDDEPRRRGSKSLADTGAAGASLRPGPGTERPGELVMISGSGAVLGGDDLFSHVLGRTVELDAAAHSQLVEKRTAEAQRTWAKGREALRRNLPSDFNLRKGAGMGAAVMGQIQREGGGTRWDAMTREDEEDEAPLYTEDWMREDWMRSDEGKRPSAGARAFTGHVSVLARLRQEL